MTTAPVINQSNSEFANQLCKYFASKTNNSEEELWNLISDKSFEEVNMRKNKKTKQKRKAKKMSLVKVINDMLE